jgi:DNA polymerase III subunit delta'
MEIAAAPPEPRANPDLIGQEAAQDVLSRAFRSGRLAHGWLLSGPEGIGKATLAYRFARALLAGPGATDRSLGLRPDHPVFRQVAQGAHPDLTVIEPERDPKTGRVKSEIPVGLVRAATQALHATAAMGGWRVVVIDGAERLNRNAANALLKSLEEPPPAAVLLLVSHRPAQLAATVRSRCAKLPLARLPDALVADRLAHWVPELGSEQRSAIALLAHGSLGRALELVGEDWLPLYGRLAEGVAGLAGDRAVLPDLASALGRHAEQRGFAGPLGLIQELLGRVVASALGRLGPALFPAEPAALDRLVRRRSLDRWAQLWETIGRLAPAVDGLNLDRVQALLHILTLLAPGSDSDELPAGGVLLGALDVPG